MAQHTAVGADDATRTSESTTTSRPLLWAHVVLGCACVLLSGDFPALFVGDVTRYAEIATGPTFWVGQEVEFPLLAAGFAWVTARWGATSLIIVPASNLVLHIATAAILARYWGGVSANRYLALSVTLLPLTLFRLDHLSVLLAVVGLALARRGSDIGAGVTLAAAVHAKLWPAALVAAFPARRGRLILIAATATVVTGVVWVATFGGDGPAQVLGFRGATGWQIESLGGSLLRLFDAGPARFEGGAWRVGRPSEVMTLVLLAFGAVVFGLTRGVRSIERRQLSLVLGLMLASPLLSPQFLIWLCPLVAIQPEPSHRRRQSQLLGVAILYTMLLALYYGYVIDGELVAMIALGLRNACLVGMLVLGLSGAWRRTREPGPQPHEMEASTT